MELFAFPLALLLLPLPLIALRLLPPRPATAGALVVPSHIAAELGGGEAVTARANRWSLALAVLAWIGLVVALAGPQRILPAAALPASSREIMLVLDLSGSMEQQDFVLDGKPVRRLDAVKAVAGDFLQRRAGDRVGLVLFADQAEVAAVPTFDLAAVADTLKDATIGILGRSTAIGDGLGLAVKRLKDSTASARVVILLSDGTNTAGAVGPESAAELAKTLGIRVHTIALGTDEELSDKSVFKSSLVDTTVLSRIAEMSGGETFRVRTLEDLEAVTAALDRLEPSATEAPPAAVAEPLWPFPAAAAFLACLGRFLIDRRRP